MENYYGIFENVIAKGGYDLTDLLAKIDTYHIEGKLTDEERDDLVEKARVGASVAGSTDVMAKLEELDKRVKALEESGTTPDDEYPEYVVGKWYYNGDKITFEEEKYICVAPEGVVCTWSPAEYPTYWEKQ